MKHCAGAILTHGNMAAASVSNIHGIFFGDKGLLISYLPLAHIYEVCVVWFTPFFF